MGSIMAAIAVPGRKLLPDGTPPPILVARMRVAVEACKALANLRLIILSGGKMPMNADEVARLALADGGRPPPTSEAEAMHRLGLELGLDPSVEVVLETEALN